MNPALRRWLRIVPVLALLLAGAACSSPQEEVIQQRPLPAAEAASDAPADFPPAFATDMPSQRAQPAAFDPDSTAIVLTDRVMQDLDPDRRFSLGIDRLKRAEFGPLDHKNVLVVSNRLALDSEGRHLLELLLPLRKPIVRRVVLFNDELSPPARGPAIDRVLAGYPNVRVFERTPESFRLTPAMLEGVDVILVDLPLRAGSFRPEAGFLGGVVEDAGVNGIPMLILDRPHPISGVVFEGPPFDPGNHGRAHAFLPGILLPGLTVAEYATFLNNRFGLGARIEVIELTSWNRREGSVPLKAIYDRAGLKPWEALSEWWHYYPSDPVAGQWRLIADLLPAAKVVDAVHPGDGSAPRLILRSAPFTPAELRDRLMRAGLDPIVVEVDSERDGTVRLTTPRLLDAPVTASIAIWGVYASREPALLPPAGESGLYGTRIVFELLREGREGRAIARAWQNLDAYKELEAWRTRSQRYR
ncbi:MAG: DUF1343 domain-containing protein [Candidatus Sumerlaeia bacterium]|nr:DUF1343 domain-containing protein [Candidatus Sumerlaeia bacterium]